MATSESWFSKKEFSRVRGRGHFDQNFWLFKIKSKKLSYSLVPKERHVLKESNDSTLALCIGPKERHGCTGLDSTSLFQ